MGLKKETLAQGGRTQRHRQGLIKMVSRADELQKRCDKEPLRHIQKYSSLNVAPREMLLLSATAAIILIASCRAASANASLGGEGMHRAQYRRLHQEEALHTHAHAHIGSAATSNAENAAFEESVRRNGDLASRNKGEPRSISYMICVDAGSSGSRVHVFKMTWGHHDGELPEIELPSKKLKVVPGLSSYESTPSEAGSSLLTLISFAKRHVPEALWGRTPFIVAATAGLRLLPQDTANAILESCERTLRTHSPFQVDASHLGQLTGDDEGVYGWITVNFLAQRLRGMKYSDHAAIGALEVGGASSQVTFEYAGPTRGRSGEERLMSVVVGGEKYTVYTHSYLGLGQDEVRRAYNHELHQSAGRMEEVREKDKLSSGDLRSRSSVRDAIGDRNRLKGRRGQSDGGEDGVANSQLVGGGDAEMSSGLQLELVDPCLPIGFAGPPAQDGTGLLPGGEGGGDVYTGWMPGGMKVIGGGSYSKCRERVLGLVDRYRDAISGFLEPIEHGEGGERGGAEEERGGLDPERWCKGDHTGADAAATEDLPRRDGWSCVVGGLFQVSSQHPSFCIYPSVRPRVKGRAGVS